MILSLDGANDLIHRLLMEQAGTFYLDSAYALALQRPFLAPIAHLLRHSQAVQGARRLLARYQLKPVEAYTDAIPIYFSAQHSLNVLARGLPAARLLILQPFAAFKQPRSAQEKAFTHYQYREPVMKVLYEEVHEGLTALAREDRVVYVDGRFAFDGRPETIFSDDVHFVSPEGYRILAEYVVSHLNEQTLSSR